jgi:hypothetical protein
VWDPDPAGARNPWRTYRLALERGLDAPAGTTHRLIVQEDVLVCDHFLEAVEAAAAARPDRVLVFFVAGHPLPHVREFDRAVRLGRPWAELQNGTWLPVVATAWPMPMVEPMLAWIGDRFASRKFPPQFTADDELVGRYLRDVGARALASAPSLVEHPDTVTSVASGGLRQRAGLDAGRCARLWIGDAGCDPRGIDWSIDPAPPD